MTAYHDLENKEKIQYLRKKYGLSVPRIHKIINTTYHIMTKPSAQYMSDPLTYSCSIDTVKTWCSESRDYEVSNLVVALLELRIQDLIESGEIKEVDD